MVCCQGRDFEFFGPLLHALECSILLSLHLHCKGSCWSNHFQSMYWFISLETASCGRKISFLARSSYCKGRLLLFFQVSTPFRLFRSGFLHELRMGIG